jgi:hypothetical protein
MAARKTMDELMNGREISREKANDRAFDRLGRQIDEADQMIGELCREGKQVFYINLKTLSGRFTGKIKEGSCAELINYLINKHYV